MAPGSRRQKTVISPPCDMISDLPVNVIEIILMRLSLRDAVRTSILSRKWRYNWVRTPQLIFDETFYRGLKNFSRNKLLMTIYQVLLRHRGPVLKFSLYVSELEGCSEIDQLIHFLSRKGVEEFTLHVGYWLDHSEPYKLPSSFFSCRQLRHLKLWSCVFKPPRVFNGFSRLKTLSFDSVDFDADLIGDIISSCPLLEKLSLRFCTRFDSLEIDAPKLKYLSFTASVYALRFKNTPLLQSLSVQWNKTEPLENLEKGQFSKMIEVFRSLPIIDDLCVGYRFMKFLTLGGVPGRLPFTLNLKNVILIGVCFCKAAMVSFTLCLIKSSPNLEEIIIDVSAGTDVAEGPALKLFEVQEYPDFSLNQLRRVRMHCNTGARPELEFIKLLLAKSPMLEMMVIANHSMRFHEELRMLQELTRCRSSSPEGLLRIYPPLRSNPISTSN